MSLFQRYIEYKNHIIFHKMSTNMEFYSTMEAKGDGMKKNKKGFTLVEIIVVLVIIGILMALAVPAVMSYVKEAADTKLISEARAVMVASKEKGIELVKEGKLNTLSTKSSRQDIIKKSDIEGELMEIQLNAAKNGAGSFIVKLQDSYVRYDDVKQDYEVLDSYSNIFSKTNTISESLFNNKDAITKMLDVFKRNTKVLNSEGKNFGVPIRESLSETLKEAGITDDDYSFRIDKQNDTEYTITVSERRIKTEDINNHTTVNVVRYTYKYDNEKKEYIQQSGVKTAVSKVTNGNYNGTSSDTYPALDLDSIQDNEWQDANEH